MQTNKDTDIEIIIRNYGLMPHPEGGFFKEIYRSAEKFETPYGMRSAATSIYYLLTGSSKSHLHKIKSDEIWHFYRGAVLRLVLFDEKSKQFKEILLSNQINVEHVCQFVVPAGIWMAAELCVDDIESYSLMGCTVSPGFDFNDFEMASYSLLEGLSEELKAMLHPFILK